MRIRMLATAAGPDGALQNGAMYDLPKNRAQALIDGGYAETVESAPKPAQAVEQAIAAPSAERADAPKRARKKTARKK